MEKLRYYSGIGSRSTPFDVLLLMEDIAGYFGKKYVLRSGGAIGADTAFENGAKSFNRPMEIFKAEDCTDEALEYSSTFHPAWDKCSEYAKKLHGRNAMIILGKDLKTPVERIICWTPGGGIKGGTGQALRIAEANGIEVYNLYHSEVKKKFYEVLYFSGVVNRTM